MLNHSQRSKAAVAESFSKAAKSYDSAAQLQRDIGTFLFDFLPHDSAPKQIVELGCGTGYFAEKLHLRYPHAQVCGLDLAEGMLQHAHDQRSQALQWLGADMESLPFADASVDLFYSSLALQWCEDLPAFFAEIQRVLAPGGCIALATLGPRTLHELRESWRAVDGFTHVNRFAEQSSLRAAAQFAGLRESRWHSADKIMYYNALRELTQELKAIGAHNVNRARAPGLTGRDKIQKLRASYEPFRQAQGLPATYEVYWALFQKVD